MPTLLRLSLIKKAFAALTTAAAIAVVFCSVESLHANTDCRSLFLRDWVQIEETKPELSKAELAKVGDTFASIESLIRNLKVPGHITIKIQRRGTVAVSYNEGLIQVPYQFVISGKNGNTYTKHPKYSQIILVHEVGHAVFNENLRTRLPNVKQADPIVSRYSELFADLLSTLHSGEINPVGKATTRKSLDSVMRRFDGRPPNVDINEMTSPYVALALARLHIGKHYIDSPIYRTRKPDLLAKVFDAIVSEIEFFNNNPNQVNMPILEINQRLIRAMDERL